LGLVSAACSGGGDPFGLTVRVEVRGLAFPVGPGRPDPDRLGLQRAFPNLSFASPLFLAHAPDGSNRLFVVEQAGRIRVFDNDDATTSASTFLDITGRVTSGGELGLLGLAFDPQYATNGCFYVHYTASGPLRSMLARFRVTSDPLVANPSSEVQLLTVNQPYSNHNGGMLAFGPDGMLYASLGDGGSGGDPLGSGQSLGTLLGKVLRLDPWLPAPYVPADNPFLGVAGARGEIWAYGLRNPWRFSFDRQTGELWLGDVGQGAREEIDLVTRGANLGWNVYEGSLPYANPSGIPLSAFTAPVFDYGRALGGCVIGGYVYRGAAVPAARGAYLYGDNGSGRVWALVRDGAGRVVESAEIGGVPSLSSFGEDRDGEIYAVSLGGAIYRLVDLGGGAGDEIPARLSETGLFEDVLSLTPAPGLIPYDVNAPLWSDGATKRRFLALPGLSRIGFAAEGAWSFPVGTVLVKHFEMPAGPGLATRLETRVLVHRSDGWAGYTYRWNAAQTDASLIVGPETAEVSTPAGPVPWYFPSRTDCLACHTAAAGFVLGVRTEQLHRKFAYPAATDNQLRAWNHVGLFDRDIGEVSAYAALADPAGASAPLADRARAYLSANCAHCHQPGAPAPGGLDLRHDVPVAAMNVVGVAATEGDLGIAGALRVKSGEKERSVLWERMRRLDAARMPPLASHRVDDAAVALLGAWIDGGP